MPESHAAADQNRVDDLRINHQRETVIHRAWYDTKTPKCALRVTANSEKTFYVVKRAGSALRYPAASVAAS